jgi:hypothetical protein
MSNRWGRGPRVGFLKGEGRRTIQGRCQELFRERGSVGSAGDGKHRASAASTG